MTFDVADRLHKLPVYLFADLRSKIAAARDKGVKVISLGIGDPDEPTPDPVVAELCRSATDCGDPNRHRYGCDCPSEQLPAAIREFYRRRFQVTLAENQVVMTMGSKDAIVKFALAVLNPGDMAMAPSPGYPTYNIGHVLAGGTTYQTPLLAENDFLVDFDVVGLDAREQSKILWLNYPNNPTTAVAPMSFFERAVQFARANDMIIAHDAAYCENTYDGYVAPSILQVPGADEVAVEFFSLSKAFNMTGWRVGCVVGNADAVAALRTAKENIDNGSMRPIQLAAAKALGMAEELTPQINAVYRRRRDMVVDALNSAGWCIEKPTATIYVWAPVPEKYKGSSVAFAADLLAKAGVVVTPGLGYGQAGEGYFRVSLTYGDSVIAEAMDRIASVGY